MEIIRETYIKHANELEIVLGISCEDSENKHERNSHQAHTFTNQKFYTYIIKGTKDFHYCGITKDIGIRIMQHNEGKNISTRSNRPYTIAHVIEFPTRQQARKMEVMIKNVGVKKYFIKNCRRIS